MCRRTEQRRSSSGFRHITPSQCWAIAGCQQTVPKWTKLGYINLALSARCAGHTMKTCFSARWARNDFVLPSWYISGFLREVGFADRFHFNFFFL
jgi:hypothetical protein